MSGKTRGWIGGDGLDSLSSGGEKRLRHCLKFQGKGWGIELNFGKVSNRCMYNSVNILLIFYCNNLTEGAHSL